MAWHQPFAAWVSKLRKVHHDGLILWSTLVLSVDHTYWTPPLEMATAMFICNWQMPEKIGNLWMPRGERQLSMVVEQQQKWVIDGFYIDCLAPGNVINDRRRYDDPPLLLEKVFCFDKIVPQDKVPFGECGCCEFRLQITAYFCYILSLSP